MAAELGLRRGIAGDGEGFRAASGRKRMRSRGIYRGRGSLEEGVNREITILRSSGFRRRRCPAWLVGGGRRRRGRGDRAVGPSGQRHRASEEGAGDRGEGAPGVRVAAGLAWRVDGPRESEREKVRCGPLVRWLRLLFYKAQTRKQNKGKTIILLYRHIIYQNVQQKKS